MSNSKKAGIGLYENLGKLYYAMAVVDGDVHTKEIDKLKEFIRKYWLAVDAVEDEYGTDAAFQIETVFDWLLGHEADGERCFGEFREFYEDHKERFTPFIKVLILDTAHAMANAFAGKNKAELVLLGKLGLFLE
ncbi:MAG TPA: hypothetical protein VLZ54_06660 [Arenibacter sp.]|nr:hypothetical protein [Arenibacter sp.]